MNQIQMLIAILLSVIVFCSTSMYYRTKIDLVETSHDLIIEKLNKESLKKEKEILELNLLFEKNINEQKAKLESEYKKNIDGIRASIARLDNIRLSDPYSNKDSGSSSTRDPGEACSNSGDPSELSRETSQFLFDLAGSADETREKLILCNQFIDDVIFENRKLIDEIKSKNQLP